MKSFTNKGFFIDLLSNPRNSALAKEELLRVKSPELFPKSTGAIYLCEGLGNKKAHACVPHEEPRFNCA
ncbi:hypothetical protein MTO96_036204 [Rhipicephalus appendiculatus]